MKGQIQATSKITRQAAKKGKTSKWEVGSFTVSLGLPYANSHFSIPAANSTGEDDDQHSGFLGAFPQVLSHSE